ncbi:MAG: DUF2461 domain-containing protein [Paludibacteraceae bacterium]|nr:DUF2461 domain-containing protein [Paludibacteraceae bacterium]
MKNIVTFINDLADNNNKAWFDANRNRWNDVRAEWAEFTEKLIAGVSKMDPLVSGLRVQDCTYRINRDIRFSSDKRPYKSHIGAYVCPYGKKSGFAGYYFHIESHLCDYIGRNMIAAGAYMLPPKELESVREEIYDNPEAFIKALDKAEGFDLTDNAKLTKCPKGFPADFKYVELLKYKSYSIGKGTPWDVLYSDGLYDWVMENFANCVEINTLLNRAIAYAREN